MNLGRWQRTIVDLAGNVIPGAVITIRRESDQQLVTVYGDKAGEHPYTPTGQATADANGYVYFYVEPGLYRITSSNPAVDWRDVEIGSVEIAQEVDQSWRDFEAQAEYEHDNLRAMLMQSRYGDGPYPTIDWQFAGASRLDPRISFSRPSADTVYDASGKLVTLGTDVPAFPFDPATGRALGFRVQAQVTNVLKGSNEPSSWRVVDCSFDTETMMAGYKVGRFVPSTASVPHYTEILIGVTSPEGTIHSAQCVVAPGEFDQLRVFVYSGDGGFAAAADLDFDGNGKLTDIAGNGNGTCSATALADGVYLVKLEGFASLAGTVADRIRVGPRQGNSVNIPSDGVKGFWVGGQQWEVGAAKCSSFIETPIASQATRAADSVVIDGDNFSRWFNPDEGTFLFSITGQETLRLRVKQAGQLWGPRYQLRIGGNQKAILTITDDTQSDSLVLSSPSTITGSDRLGFSYAGGEFRVGMNGATQSGTAATLPSNLAQADITTAEASNEVIIGSMQYFPRALSDAKLQELTA